MIRTVVGVVVSLAVSVIAQKAPDLSVGVLPQLFIHGGHFSVCIHL
jgi:hypothetical protein